MSKAHNNQDVTSNVRERMLSYQALTNFLSFLSKLCFECQNVRSRMMMDMLRLFIVQNWLFTCYDCLHVMGFIVPLIY